MKHKTQPKTPTAGLLLALASAAAFAQAPAGGGAPPASSVTVYGVMDAGLYARQLSGQTRVKAVDSGIMETSFLGLRGSEDLGDGLRANFDISSFLRLDSGEPTRGIPGESFWSRGAWVGMAGGFGSVRLGRIATMNFINTIRFNAFGPSSVVGPSFLHTYVGSAAQPMTTGSGVTDSAWNNALAYTSPVFGGATVALQAAPSEGGTAGRRVGASVSWGGQPFAVMLSMDRTSRAALTFPLAIPTLPGAVPPFTASDFETVQLGSSYDIGVVKLFGQVGRTKITGTRAGPPGEKTIDLKTVQLGLSAPIGAGNVLLSAANTAKEQTLVADQKRTTVSLGYDHNLSKRTDLYAVVMTDKVSTLGRGTGFALGARHRF